MRMADEIDREQASGELNGNDGERDTHLSN
jgi:hypothetical protein